MSTKAGLVDGAFDLGPANPRTGLRALVNVGHDAGVKKRSRLRKPDGWPKYMVSKALGSGQTAYYWSVPSRYRKKGCPVCAEALGSDYGRAVERANLLNQQFEAWRLGRGGPSGIKLSMVEVGTLLWCFREYEKSPAFSKLALRTQKDYRRCFSLILELPMRGGGRLGNQLLRRFDARAADRVYQKLLHASDGRKRYRQANLTIDVARKAWSVVQRYFPDIVPDTNPFAGVTRERRSRETAPATREQATVLADTLTKLGHPHLGVTALICFELHMRPENILDGHLTWTDIQPDCIRIVHHKTSERVWIPVGDQDGLFYPELMERLQALPKLGAAVVLTPGKRGISKPYSHSYARRMVREARRAAGLPEYVGLAACRHGGMTELGNAGLTEQQVMASSGHKTPDAARLYVHRTRDQLLAAGRKRRAYRDGTSG